MDIGRTYQNLDNYISAINRFKTVVELYSKTSHVPEALARLTETYYRLGLYNEAKVYASVLGYWHRDTICQWTKDQWNRLTRKVEGEAETGQVNESV